MNKTIGFMISMLVFLSMDVRAETKSAARHPASIKTEKELKKSSDKKIPEHYAEHMFNQAEETPAKIKELGL
jgi:hypothetical protein